VSKTSNSSKFKTWYLKEITVEQLFIISMQEFIQRVFFLLTTSLKLKSSKLDTPFYFDLIILDHHCY